MSGADVSDDDQLMQRIWAWQKGEIAPHAMGVLLKGEDVETRFHSFMALMPDSVCKVFGRLKLSEILPQLAQCSVPANKLEEQRNLWRENLGIIPSRQALLRLT